MIYPLQSRGAQCPVPCATAAACCHCCASVCRAAVRTAVLLRYVGCVLAMGCVLAVSRVAHVSKKTKNIKGFPYRYEGFIGVGDRVKKRPRKIESVFRFRFIFPTEKPTNSGRFSVGKADEKPTEQNDFRFSVHNTGCGMVRFPYTHRSTSSVLKAAYF